MELVNIYHLSSLSFVEIMRLFVVSVRIYGSVGITWRSYYRIID